MEVHSHCVCMLSLSFMIYSNFDEWEYTMLHFSIVLLVSLLFCLENCKRMSILSNLDIIYYAYHSFSRCARMIHIVLSSFICIGSCVSTLQIKYVCCLEKRMEDLFPSHLGASNYIHCHYWVLLLRKWSTDIQNCGRDTIYHKSWEKICGCRTSVRCTLYSVHFIMTEHILCTAILHSHMIIFFSLSLVFYHWCIAGDMAQPNEYKSEKSATKIHRVFVDNLVLDILASLILNLIKHLYFHMLLKTSLVVPDNGFSSECIHFNHMSEKRRVVVLKNG